MIQGDDLMKLYTSMDSENQMLKQVYAQLALSGRVFGAAAFASRLNAEGMYNGGLVQSMAQCQVQPVAATTNTVRVTVSVINHFGVPMDGWGLCLNVEATRVRIWSTAPDKDSALNKMYFIAVPSLRAGQQYTTDLRIEDPYTTSAATLTFCLFKSCKENPVRTHLYDHVTHVFDSMVSFTSGDNEKRLAVTEYACMAGFKCRLAENEDKSKPLTCAFTVLNRYLPRVEGETLEQCVFRVFLPHSNHESMKDGYLIRVDDNHYLTVTITSIAKEDRFCLRFDIFGPNGEYVAQALTEAMLWRISILVQRISRSIKPASLKALRRAVKVTLPWSGDWTKNCYITPPAKH